MNAWIGTSGWSYNNWKEGFYPKGLNSLEWLTHYALNFNSLEVNSTFYVLPALKTIERWRNITPEHFLFSLKC